jgi:hypothetical protein
MPNEQHNPAKFAFYYMLSLVALVLTSLSTGMIIFQIINKYVKDNFSTYTSAYSSGEVVFAISAIFVAAPIYFLLMKEIHKNIKSGALPLDSGIRKWLTYFILLISSVVSIGWLIATLNSFFRGEYTLKFILKAITAISISMSIFSYYLLDMRRKDAGADFKQAGFYLYGSLAVVVAAFLTGVVLESPLNARAKRHDEIVVSRLETIEANINSYYSDQKALPENLKLLTDNVKFFLDPNSLTDPQTGEEFRYRVISEKKYELCAEFMTESEKQAGFDVPFRKWEHGMGEKCFEREVMDFSAKGVEVMR